MTHGSAYLVAYYNISACFIFFPVILILWINLFPIMRRLLGPELETCWCFKRRFFLGSILLAVGALIVLKHAIEVVNYHQWHGYFMEAAYAFSSGWELLTVMRCFAVGLLPFMGGVTLVKAYEKLANNHVSEAERQIGLPGMRAWCNKANLILIIGLSFCLSFVAMTYSFWGILFIGFLALIAYPGIRTLLAPQQLEQTMQADISPERARVLKLIEEGKITPDEGAELLSALAATIPQPASVQPFTKSRKLMLGGAAVVLLGFFLPWFSFNMMDELNRAMSAVQQQIPGMPQMNFPSNFGAPQQLGWNTSVSSQPQVQSSSVNITGGEVGHGLGWLILLLSIGGACLPYVATGMSEESRKITMRISIAAAGIVSLYLLTNALRMLSFGLPIVILGLIVQAVGLIHEMPRPTVRVTSQPAVAAGNGAV